jgi:hypothetical protein
MGEVGAQHEKIGAALDVALKFNANRDEVTNDVGNGVAVRVREQQERGTRDRTRRDEDRW